jgi:2-polyprenyl-3-methyl-5-hydroxy-6-metoxy-1,4-benzoquinol methylase
MDQQELVRQVLHDLPDVPEAPVEGRYLTTAEAEAIVEETIEHVQRTGAAREYVYLNGHRRRLTVSLTMIPKAEGSNATCLDIGCYGYMAFWAWRHLGYARVLGIEMRPGEAPVLTRSIEMGGQRLDLEIRNFNITEESWPLEGNFDTILFFETLEHVDRDPSGVMLNVTRRMTRDSILIISVPNAISYKTLQEFLTGAPPWTYWFFHPDLNHEPRHSFEYTPIFFKIFLRAAGLAERAFRTICAYVERKAVEDIFEIGATMSIEPRMFGETMIVQARKVDDEPLFRYPDCIYDGDHYYRSTFPVLSDRLGAARLAIADRSKQAERTVQEVRQQAEEAEQRARAAEAVAREAEALCESYRTKLDEAATNVQRADAARQEAEQRVRAAEAVAQEALEARDAANSKARVAAARSREAMFLCENYRTKLDEAATDVQQADAARREAEQQADAARREAEQQADAARREAGEAEQRADAARREAEQRADAAEALYQAINRSTFWRVTGPFRRLGSRFPGTTSRVRRVLARPARFCRGIVSRDR